MIEVAIYDSGTFLQHWPCTPTTLPDGAAGVVWRGVPYRLLPDNRIDVGTPPPAPPPGLRCAVIAGEDGSWLLVAGLAGALAEAQAVLAGQGVRVLRTGRWLGDPVEGEAFDWFIRCDGAIPPEALAALSGTQGPVPAAADRLAALESRLAEALAELAQPRPAAVPSAPAEPDPALLHLQAELDALRAERARLSAPAPAAPKLHRELAGLLAVLRPDLRLLRDSLATAAGEFPSRDGVWRGLAELPVDGSRPHGWKALRGAERWWERHVSTGTDDTGRLYARFDRGARAWDVLLGWKAEQSRDIAWLGRQG